MKVALVQLPAWGALPPLGAASLKAYLDEHAVEAKVFDINLDFYLSEHEGRVADDSGAYGADDPWGAHAFDQWGVDKGRLAVDPNDIRFMDGSKYLDSPLPIDEWVDEILDWNPTVVGFTVYITSLCPSLLVSREIKRRRPEVVIVFGGPEVSMENAGELALTTRVPDAVVDAEGEAVLLDIVRHVEAGRRDFTDIPGLATLNEGMHAWTERRPLIKPIDSLPFPDFSDLEWERYPNPYLIPIMSSRGCVLHCAFCYETVFWRRFRTQSPERIVAEIEHQIAHHPLLETVGEDGKRFYFMFADSLVNGHIGGLRRFAELLIERDVGINWGGQATINTKMDTSYFTTLHESGCTGLAFGLESGSQRVLDAMGKHFNIDDAARFIRSAHEAGVTVTANIMVGFPTESFRDFLSSMGFLFRTRKWLYQVSNVTTTQIALGSDLHTNPEKYGMLIHPDGSWTSAETGDDYARDRRLRVLHRWMQLWRIPHQEISPEHRSRRRRRRNHRIGNPTNESSTEAEPARLPFPLTGSGPRNSPPRDFVGVPPSARLSLDEYGSLTVHERNADIDSVEAFQTGANFEDLVAWFNSELGSSLTWGSPVDDDPEQILVKGRSETRDSEVTASVVPIRADDGHYEGAHIHLWLQPTPHPVTLRPYRREA